MGDLNNGHAWESGDTVTPDDLNAMVEDATIKTSAVVAAKIASDAVEEAKIKADAVVTAKIKDANVSPAKLGALHTATAITAPASTQVALWASAAGALESMTLANMLGTVLPVPHTFYDCLITPRSSTEVDVEVAHGVFTDANGIPRVASVSGTLSITSSGANGLDTGSRTASTGYYIYAIYKSDVSGGALLFSLSSSAPTLPGGYRWWCRLGFVRTHSNSDLLEMVKRGRMALVEPVQMGTAASPANNWMAPNDNTAFIPDYVTAIYYQIKATAAADFRVAVRPAGNINATELGAQYICAADAGSATGFPLAAATVKVPWTGANTGTKSLETPYWKCSQTSGVSIHMIGFEM